MSKSLLFCGAALALGQAAAGLNLTFTGNCTSNSNSTNNGNGLRDVAYFNTTSTTQFTVPKLTGNDDPWYSYLTLTNSGSSGFIDRWLGVPESFLKSDAANGTTACLYTAGGLDKKLKNTQGNSTCDGVLSDKCTESISKLTPSSFGSTNCPSTDPDSDCNWGGVAGIELSLEQHCFQTNLPGVDVPEGYIIVPFLGISYSSNDDSKPFKGYDEAASQTIASLFAFVRREEIVNGSLEKVAAAQPVCAIPNKVQKDSRPVDSPAGKLQQPAWLASVMVVLAVRLGLSLL